MKNPDAQSLGRLGRGVKKRFSAAEIERRTARIREAQAQRAAAQRAAREACGTTENKNAQT